ncbi:hypothetical protein HZA99_05295 [Candidatus Woesearchaeota archaeon]|nr:hypothetical protein [Candidatus Woesearchaeota archaeon]
MSDEVVGVEIPALLRNRLPISLDGLVVTGPEFVNHGEDYHRWRIHTAEGDPVGQVRVYSGRRNELGHREEVYIPGRVQTTPEPLSLPYAESFSRYLRDHLERYLASQADTTLIDVALRKGPEMPVSQGNSFFLRWNVYFKDEKIGEYTLHDYNPKTPAAGEGERNYSGRIPGYANPSVVAWNEGQYAAKGITKGTEAYENAMREGILYREDMVILRWANLPGIPTPDNKYSLQWKRGDFLKIPFP